MTKDTATILPNASIIESEIDGDISLYDPASETVTVLNGTASDVWRLCDGQHTEGEIVELLASAYDVDAETIRDDVSTTLEQFEKSGLVDFT